MKKSIFILCAILITAACQNSMIEKNTGNRDANEPKAQIKSYSTLEEYAKSIDYSCGLDSDCEIKDVHNCCGAYPECVNINAAVDPGFVDKACEKENLGGICGFPSIDSCRCANKKCQGYMKNDADQPASISNPASANCLQKGGRLEIRNNKNGQYGVCLFEDNRQCEEWALFRGQCPVGGLKITGYENEAQAYCAITGGQVEGLDTPVPMCKRVDGTYCSIEANFNGDCPNPGNPNPNAGNVEAE